MANPVRKDTIQKRFASPENAIPSGSYSIIVALAVGGAIIIASLLIWQSKAANDALITNSEIEEQVRQKLHVAKLYMQEERWEEAAKIAFGINKQLDEADDDDAYNFKELQVLSDLTLAEAQLKMKEFAEAEKNFSRAMSYMSAQNRLFLESALFGRAKARCRLGLYKEAEEDLNQLLGINPNFGAAYAWRSQVRRKLDKLEDAANDEQKSHSLAEWLDTPQL